MEEKPKEMGWREALREKIRNGPLWLRLAVAVVFIVLGGLARKQTEPAPTGPQVIVQPTAPAVEVKPAVPQIVVNTGDVGSAPARPVGYHLFAARERHRVADELRANGFKSVGGPGKVAEADVQRLMRHLDDDTIHAGVAETGALGDGSILKVIRAVIRWPLEHPEQAKRLLEFLLMILLPLL